MALPIGKLTILVGAGIVGSVLAKEGRMPSVSDFFSGALKIVWKQIRQDDSTASSAKPRNDSLLAQVNSLRQELQLLASSRPVTIVTSSGSGGSRYGIIVVVVVIGYGYVWWKGWKLPDMMFATKRSLSDACTTVAGKLDDVYSTLTVTKRDLSSRIDRVDCRLDECAEVAASTGEEVSEVRGKVKDICEDVLSVQNAVQTLETKINRIGRKQDFTIEGVRRLFDMACITQNSTSTDRIQASPSSSSRPALELPPMTPLSRTVSLPPKSLLELPSPASASNGSHQGLHGISDVVNGSSSPGVANGVRVTKDPNNGNSSSGLSGQTHPGYGAGFIARTLGAMQSFKRS